MVSEALFGRRTRGKPTRTHLVDWADALRIMMEKESIAVHQQALGMSSEENMDEIGSPAPPRSRRATVDLGGDSYRLLPGQAAFAI